MAVTSIRSNSQPSGGVGAQQPVDPISTPADIRAMIEQLTPIQARFRAASSPLSVFLNQATFTALGQPQSVPISAVGLGYQLITEWNAVITIANGVTAAEIFKLSPLFPYCLIANTQVQINGGAVVYSASGPATLSVMTRQRTGSRRLSTLGNFGPGFDPALVRITLGSNLTATSASFASSPASPTVSGIASISVAGSASTNNTLTVTWYTFEKLALDRDSLLGSLPLQNNSTSATVNRTPVSALSGTRNDLNMPFFTAGADLTFTLTTLTAKTTYKFMSVPNDPGLYQPMVANSYQVQEQTALQVAATGAGAFVYNIPQNLYLLAAHIMGVDSTGAALPYSWLDPLRVQYNGGSIIPVVRFQGRDRAEQYLSYSADQANIPGLRMWDGEDTSDDINASDDMGWLDTYQAASPQLNGDVASATSTSVTYNLTREQVVAGAVQVIGG